MPSVFVFAGLNDYPPPIALLENCRAIMPEGTCVSTFGPTVTNGVLSHWKATEAILNSDILQEALDEAGKRLLEPAIKSFLQEHGLYLVDVPTETRAWYIYCWLNLQ